MNIKLISDINVSLYNFVSSLSLWSTDVAEGYIDFFNKHSYLTEEEKTLLLKFKDIRNPMGWEEEGKLLLWAYGGFQINEKYLSLKNIVDYFKDRKLLDGKTIYELLQDKLPIVENAIKGIEREYVKMDVQKILGKLKEINLYSNKEEEICFIVFNPSIKTIGGANGDVLIFEYNGGNDYKVWAGIILHEAIHLVVKLWSKLSIDIEYKDIFNAPFPLWKDRDNKNVLDELFVYSVINVTVDPINIKDQIEKYRKYVNDDKKEYMKDLLFIWEHLEDFQSIVNNFLDMKFSGNVAYKEMVIRYLQYIDISPL